MANRSKDVGTRFETAVCRYLREALGDERIERRAPHGSHDMGDLFGIRAHGWEGIAECKCHKVVTDSLIAEWQRQTEAERGNADAGFALLVVRREGCNYEDHTARRFGLHRCFVQMRDLLRIAGVSAYEAAYEAALDEWVELPLARACALTAGEVR